MIINFLITVIICIYNVQCQSTFGPLSTAGITTGIIQTVTTGTFGPLSTATTASAITTCSASNNICKNGGLCYILNGRDIICTCPAGFTGIHYIISNKIIICECLKKVQFVNYH